MAEELKSLLAEVQLESFFVKLRDNLQVTRLEHFDSVKPHDLAKIGMSKPAIRRLKKALHERKASAKPGFQKFLSMDNRPPLSQELTRSSLACLISESELVLSDKLGDGSFGVVKKALWKKTGQYVAVKVLKRDLITNDQVLEDFIREVNVMHGLNHVNLVKLHGVCLGPQHMMVTELAPYGALLDYLHTNHSKLLLSTLHSYAFQLAGAMAYLESKCFIHRDIALRNIFLLTPEHLKLGDFGLARILSPQNNVYIMAPDRKVPYAWCAPESLKRREFTHAADAWMYAVTLWELYTFGQEPWMGFNGAEILYKIDTGMERLARPECCPTQIYQMMLQCWLPDPDDRPTFVAIYSFLSESHPTEMRAKTSFFEPNDSRKLRLELDDMVLVVDGRPEKRWWFGQNKRTLAFGYFPRPILDPLRPLSTVDISKPLSSTFVHLGSSESGGIENMAAIPEQTYVEAPLTLRRISQEDSTSLNPTYLACRKVQNGGISRASTMLSPPPNNFNSQHSTPKTLPNTANLTLENPFVVDVFMPELFALPGPSETPKQNGGGGGGQNFVQNVFSPPPAPQLPVSHPISVPTRQAPRAPSLIDRSSAHYDHLPQPLLPSPDRRTENGIRKMMPYEQQQQVFIQPQPQLQPQPASRFQPELDPFFVDQAIRDVVAGFPASASKASEISVPNNAANSESRSRRSAPVDGQVPFQPIYNQQQQTQISQQVPVQPAFVMPGYSAAGDLATQNRMSSSVTFSSMHSQLANLFHAPTLRPSHSSNALSTLPQPQSQPLPPVTTMVQSQLQQPQQPMFVRLPPPENHPKIASSNGSSRRVTPQSASSTPENQAGSRGSPIDPNFQVIQPQINNSNRVPASTNVVQVHKPATQPAAPLLPGNYRTAKFLEMASLSPTRQQQTSQTGASKITSKYTKTEDVLQQLRGTLELAQQRRQQAEQDVAEARPQKVRELVALGLAPEEVCRQLLVKHNWNIEAAGSELAERACSTSNSRR